MRAFLDEEIEALLEGELVGEDPGEWNLEGLSNALHGMGITGEGTDADDLWDVGNREAIAEHVSSLADARLDARATEVGARTGRPWNGWSSFGRSIRCGSST